MHIPKSIKNALLCGLAGVTLMTSTTVQTNAKSNTFNMSYAFYGSTQELTQDVDATNGALQVISPEYWQLTTDGSLQNSAMLDTSFITAMHTRNIKVVPFLGNNFDRALAEAALNNRTKLTQQIADSIQKYNLDGINVDLENLTDASRNALTDFLTKLRAALPAGKEVSMAVPPNPDGEASGYNGAYNYKALAAVSDYLMLMAYDEHYPGDPVSGPVASLPFVEKSVQYALTQVDSNKVVLGIPFYGRFWNGQSSFNGTGITNEAAVGLAAKYNGSETYDEASQSVRSEFTIHTNDPRTSVLGQTLPNGSYTLWYENERSLKAKLDLVHKYNLKGTGSWSLNQAAANTWSYYKQWMDGYYFADMENHWAQDDVTKAATAGWMVGVSATQFAPDQPLTRAQAASVLARAIGLANPPASLASTASLTPFFTDVAPDYWAYTAISALWQKGIIKGISSNSFAPNAPMTREQISSLLTQLLKLKTDTASPKLFTDVDSSQWSYSAITTLTANGIIFGYDDGSFRPSEFISRAQMAEIMVRIKDQLAALKIK